MSALIGKQRLIVAGFAVGLETAKSICKRLKALVLSLFPLLSRMLSLDTLERRSGDAVPHKDMYEAELEAFPGPTSLELTTESPSGSGKQQNWS